MNILIRENIIKKILLEYHGNQTDVEAIENLITDDIISGITEFLPIIIKQGMGSFINTTEITNEQNKENTKISTIKTKVDITIDSETKSSGNFNPTSLKLIDNGEYSIDLLVKLKLNPEDIKKIKPEIAKIVSHELHHAYREIKLIGKTSKSTIYNLAQNFSKFGLQDKINQYPELKEFMLMFYLTLPQEITARVQETATILKTIKSDNRNEIMNQLLRYQPFVDAKKMMKYNINNLNNVNADILNTFIEQFNENIKYYSDLASVEIKTKNTIDSFLRYWGLKINIAGTELFKKITILIGDKNVNENEYKIDMLELLMK